MIIIFVKFYCYEFLWRFQYLLRNEKMQSKVLSVATLSVSRCREALTDVSFKFQVFTVHSCTNLWYYFLHFTIYSSFIPLFIFSCLLVICPLWIFKFICLSSVLFGIHNGFLQFCLLFIMQFLFHNHWILLAHKIFYFAKTIPFVSLVKSP